MVERCSRLMFFFFSLMSKFEGHKVEIDLHCMHDGGADDMDRARYSFFRFDRLVGQPEIRSTLWLHHAATLWRAVHDTPRVHDRRLHHASGLRCNHMP